MRKERKAVILNVDDVDAVRYGATRVLKKAGFEVWEAASGREALNKAQDMPDLVILNVNLPDISGFEVCKRIKSDPAKRNIPVLYLSATYTGTKKRITDLDYGANGYLVQPVEPDELVAHVRVLLRIKEAEETASWEAKQWHLTFDAANDAICTLDREQKIQRCNKAFSRLLGKESGDITGRHCWELIHGTQEPIPECPITRMKKSLRREYMELAIDRNWFLVTVDPILDEAGVLAGGVHTLHDITERKQAELREKLAREVLELLNRPEGFTNTVREILLLIKNRAGFDAVGIRLQKGDDFPYYETNGFSEDFVQAESSLCALDEEGKIIRDGQGNPVLECMCGNIICGRTNPALPFFTEGGSFWTNCTTDLLASTAEEDRQARTRNRCNGEGYESVALIPLRSGDNIIGLLQLNDCRRNQFTPEMISFFEGIGASIGITLYRKRAEEALQKSEAFFKAVTENSLDSILILDRKGAITYASPSTERFSGYKPEELIGKSGFDFILPADFPRAIYDFGKAVLTKKDVVIPNAFHCRHKNGSERILEGIGNNLLDYPAVAGFVVNFRDITDRKRLTDVIQAERDKLETVTKNIGVGLAIISKDYRTIWANDVIRDIFGETEGKLCYVTYNHQQTICPWCGVRRVFEAGEDNVVTEAEGYDKDGGWIWSQIIATPIRDESGEVTAALEVVVPITERKRAEEEIKRSHQQLRDLAKRRQQVVEESRIIISREIHDELGGGLTGLKMDLAWLLHKVYAVAAGKERTALMEKIYTSSELIDQMIQVIRRIATDLRPSVLDDLGLIAALEWQLEEFKSRTEIPFEFATEFDSVTLEQDTATAVFRIFQEALNNVARHSGATKVTVLLREEDGNIFLEIRDNGRGITEGEMLNTKSLGLLGMRERALVFGGDLRISGEPDSGTAVVLKIPQEQGETP